MYRVRFIIKGGVKIEQFLVYKEYLKKNLEEHFIDNNVIVHLEYSPDKRKYPLMKDSIFVGYKGIKNIDKVSFVGEMENGGESFAKSAIVDISLDVYIPAFKGGGRCHEIFSNLVQYFGGNKKYNMDYINAGEIKYDSLQEAFSLNVRLGLNILFGFSKEGKLLKEVNVVEGSE